MRATSYAKCNTCRDGQKAVWHADTAHLGADGTETPLDAWPIDDDAAPPDGAWTDVYRCTNCSAIRIPRAKITKALPEKPTRDDLTPSQRRAVDQLVRVYGGKYAETTMTGGNDSRTLIVTIVDRFSAKGWLIGARGKVRKYA